MAVLRQEIDARIGVKDTRTVGAAQVQDAAYRPEEVVRVGESTSWRNNLVESIAGTVIRVGEKMVGVAQENAYLEGQAKAGRIKSEEELEGDWLTKDWAVAATATLWASWPLPTPRLRWPWICKNCAPRVLPSLKST